MHLYSFESSHLSSVLTKSKISFSSDPHSELFFFHLSWAVRNLIWLSKRWKHDGVSEMQSRRGSTGFLHTWAAALPPTPAFGRTLVVERFVSGRSASTRPPPTHAAGGGNGAEEGRHRRPGLCVEAPFKGAEYAHPWRGRASAHRSGSNAITVVHEDCPLDIGWILSSKPNNIQCLLDLSPTNI
jgi:hypothetical protein